MKRIFLIGLAVAAMFTACNQDETLEMAKKDGAITFAPYAGKATRTLIINDKDVLPNFAVYGWRTDVNGNNEAVVFEWQDCSNNGFYTPVKYWEEGFKYQFEAIYPNPGDKVVVNTLNRQSGNTYKFINDGTNDLVYARPAETAVVNNDLSNVSAVQLNFVHLLSRVRFYVNNKFPENSTVKLVVKSITIEGCKTSGVINPGVITGKKVAGVWSDLEGSQSIVFTKQKPENNSTSAEGELLSGKEISPMNQTSLLSEAKYVFPGSFTRTVKIVFELRQYVSSTSTTYTSKEYSEEFDLDVTGANGLQQGVAYGINLNIGADAAGNLKPIEFTVNVQSWDEEMSSAVIGTETGTENN